MTSYRIVTFSFKELSFRITAVLLCDDSKQSEDSKKYSKWIFLVKDLHTINTELMNHTFVSEKQNYLKFRSPLRKKHTSIRKVFMKISF